MVRMSTARLTKSKKVNMAHFEGAEKVNNREENVKHIDLFKKGCPIVIGMQGGGEMIGEYIEFAESYGREGILFHVSGHIFKDETFVVFDNIKYMVKLDKEIYKRIDKANQLTREKWMKESEVIVHEGKIEVINPNIDALRPKPGEGPGIVN